VHRLGGGRNRRLGSTNDQRAGLGRRSLASVPQWGSQPLIGKKAQRILGAPPGPVRPAWAGRFTRQPAALPNACSNPAPSRVVATALVSDLVAFALMVGSWWLFGAAALQGHLERGWLWAWAMLLLTFVLFRSNGGLGGRPFGCAGGRTGSRALAGRILRLPADEVAGQRDRAPARHRAGG